MTDDQADRVIALLTEIRDALVGAPPDPDAPCEHPAEQRIDLSTLRRIAFKCRACDTIVARDRATGAPIEL